MMKNLLPKYLTFNMPKTIWCKSRGERMRITTNRGKGFIVHTSVEVAWR